MRQFHHVRRVVSHVLFVAVLFSSNPQFLVAQFTAPAPVCGSIEEPDGQIRELDLGNCENPFNAESGFPFTAILAGGILTEGAVFTLSLPSTETLLVEPTGSAPVEYVTVYRKLGDDYQAVSVADTAFPRQYEVSFNTPGEYVLVINQDTGLVTQRETDAWLASLIPHAMAQSGDDVGATGVFARQFTIQEEVIEAPCGFIITPNLTEPVADCDNPFGFANPNADLAVTFASSTIEDGGSYPLLDVFASFQVTDFDPFANIARLQLFRHVGDDYVQEVAGDVLRNDVSYEFASPGTYTIIFEEESLTVSQRSFDRFLQLLGPTTAHAAAGDRTIITFTITELTGASSVLFLPGIQASRLYERQIGFDAKRWEPFGNRDVRALEMTAAGVSVNDIYTEDILDEIYGISNIYQGFQDYLDTLVENDTIADWEAFAYDWRYSVFDVVERGTQYEDEIRFPIPLLESLAAESKSGKVSLVAHSNGGLLAKAIMIALEEEGKSHLVDTVVLLASPQIGTPKAIGTVLHGYDQEQGGGYIIDDAVARLVIKNLPGAYGLIPGEAYFDATNDLLISFDASEATSFWRESYANSVGDETELVAFMIGAEGRAEAATIEEAGLANATMLATGLQEQALLQAWRAPAGVKVTEIVGVGLETVSGFEYTEFRERICRDFDVFGVPECAFENFYKPVPYFSLFGDETVMAPSAEAYAGEKETYYVDLNALDIASRVEPINPVQHADITEADSIKNLLGAILTKNNPAIRFISQTRPTYANNRSVLGTHSPVELRVTDASGATTGKTEVNGITIAEENIPGSAYIELAGSTYIVVPEGGTYEVSITGTGEGGMTFTRHSLAGEIQTLTNKISIATVTASTTITLSQTAGELSNLVIDENGDGTTDYELTPAGEVVVEEVLSYALLVAEIQSLGLKKRLERQLVLKLEIAERFGDASRKPRDVFQRIEDRLLKAVKQTVKQLLRSQVITTAQKDRLTDILNGLIKLR